MAKKWFRGGAFTLRAEGDASYDGDWDYDDSGDSYTNSNWIDNTGAGCAKPVTGTDEAIFSEFASIVPVGYAESYQHIVGKRFHCCKNLDQTALDLNGITVTKGYDGGIYQKKSHTLDASAAVTDGGNTKFPCTNHTMVVGDYVTIGGTTYYNGEARVLSIAANVSFTLDMPFTVAETFATTDTAVGRTPLQVSIADGYEIAFRSDCTAYIEASSTSQNIPSLIVNSDTGLLHISSDGNGNWDDIWVQKAGTLVVADDTHFTKISTTGEAGDATIIVGKDCIGPAAASADLDAIEGTITWDSKIGDINIDGEAVVTYCENVDLATAVNIDKILVRGAGVFNWYGKSTMSDYEQWSGTITALGDADKVIGSGASTAYPQHGGTFDLSQAGGRVTFGSGDSIDHQSGELKPAQRCNVSW